MKISTNKDFEALVERAFVAASRRMPYWSVELAALTPLLVTVPDPSFAACVSDKWVVILNEDVAGKWKHEELATVLLHELLHLWQQHGARAKALGIVGQESARNWNIACDAEINDDLRDAGCKFPGEPVFPETIGCPVHLTAEDYYAALLAKQGSKQAKQAQPMSAQGCGSGAGAPTQIEQELQDEIDASAGVADDASDKTEQTAAKAHAAGSASGDADDAGGDDMGKYAGLSSADSQALVDSMTDSVARAAQQGSIPSGIRLDAQRRKKSKVDWRAQLRTAVRRATESVKGNTRNDWSRFARRTYGQFLQPRQVEPKVRVMVVMDTSGSMVNLLENALAEVRGVLETTRSEVMWGQCDAEMHELREVSVQDVDKIKLRGGGGTDFRPAFDAHAKLPRNKRANVLVYITDGYGTAPATPPADTRVIWAMLGGTNPPVAWGSSVIIQP